MKAMILAAGLGTRLRPLTGNTPKALIPVAGVPMLEIVLKQLKKYGFNEVIINLHYLPDQIIDFLKKKDHFGMSIRFSDESEQLLDTGGAIKKASWFFDDNTPFLVHNVDEITDINLTDLVNYHRERQALATLAVKKSRIARGFLFDKDFNLCGWEDRSSGEKQLVIPKKDQPLYHYGFCGIHVIDPAIFGFLKEEGAFSIIPCYLDLAGSHRITGYHAKDNIWIDIGSRKQLIEANKVDPGLYR